MIPGRYLEDLKSANMRHVDFQATFLEVCFSVLLFWENSYRGSVKMFEGQYTTLGTHTRLLPQAVRIKLNQYLGRSEPRVTNQWKNTDLMNAKWTSSQAFKKKYEIPFHNVSLLAMVCYSPGHSQDQCLLLNMKRRLDRDPG